MLVLVLKWPNVHSLLVAQTEYRVSADDPSLVKPSPDTSLPFFFFWCNLSPHNPFISSSFYLTLSKPSLSPVNTPRLSSYVVPPCLPKSPSLPFGLPPWPSHSHQRTFRETLQACLFALLSSFAKNPNHRAPTTCFTFDPSKESRDSRWSWLSVFSRTFWTTGNVIYQLGCVPQLGNVTVWHCCGGWVVWIWLWGSSSINQSKAWSIFKHHYSLCLEQLDICNHKCPVADT